MVKVTFKELEHEYYLDGDLAVSCTQFVDSFFESFDVSRMSKLVAKRRRLSGELNSKGKPITARDVKKEWKLSGDIAIARGNLVHKEMEMVIDYSFDTSLLEVFHPCSLKGYSWFKTMFDTANVVTIAEGIVFNKELLLAGTIDARVVSNNKTYLIDWKTNSGSLEKSYGYLKHPLIKSFKLPNNKLTRYYLQLSVYKRLLELNNVDVHTCYIVHLGDDSFKFYEVPDYSAIVDVMFLYRKEFLGGYLNE